MRRDDTEIIPDFYVYATFEDSQALCWGVTVFLDCEVSRDLVAEIRADTASRASKFARP